MKDIFSALIKAQSEMKIAIKDNTNPHFRNRYADFGSVYDACRDALHRNGLAVLQPTRIHESGVTVVVTRIIHTSGQFIEGEYPVLCKDPSDPQKHGGGLTYARRYALASMLSVLQDDDDGNQAAGHEPSPKVSVNQNIARAASPAAELLAMHGKSMADIETALGAKQQNWTTTQKEKAKSILHELKAGKSWVDACK